MNETLSQYVQDRHNTIRKWKEKTGKKVYGYFCCITPEEVLHAADVLPVRITGTGEPLQQADQHIASNSCPFARSCLDAGMRGIYDYLDGVVIPNSCDFIFMMEHFWKTFVPRPKAPSLIAGVDIKPYIHYINYPEKITGRDVLIYYKEVLMSFKQELERSLHRSITDEDLARSIAVYNENKTQMRRMYEMRKAHPPAISGYDAWQVTFAGISMRKEEHTALLKEYLDGLEAKERKDSKRVRIYLSGSAMDSVGADLYKIIEEAGGEVVSDDLCVGTRLFWYPLDANLPPLEAIARRSLGTACPRSTVAAPIPENRWAHMLNTTKDFNVQGAIFYILKCCDARLVEFPHLRDRLKNDLGIPVLALEGDYSAEGIEQMRGRVEAFIEMIKG